MRTRPRQPDRPFGDLDNVTVHVEFTEIGSIRTRLAIFASIPVVGARDVDLASMGIGLYILAAVHRRGFDSISGHPGEDQHLLMCHAGTADLPFRVSGIHAPWPRLSFPGCWVPLKRAT